MAMLNFGTEGAAEAGGVVRVCDGARAAGSTCDSRLDSESETVMAVPAPAAEAKEDFLVGGWCKKPSMVWRLRPSVDELVSRSSYSNAAAESEPELCRVWPARSKESATLLGAERRLGGDWRMMRSKMVACADAVLHVAVSAAGSECSMCAIALPWDWLLALAAL
jgi:hypothetical protein